MGISNGGGSGSGGGGGIGSSLLIYRYTVSGSDKASIDTGVDAPQAGSNDWTNGDLLEVFSQLRTDNAGALDGVNFVVNNDGGGNYDIERLEGSAAAASAANSLAATAWGVRVHGSGGTAGYASAYHMVIPRFAGTTFFKTAALANMTPDGALAANNVSDEWSLGWRSTAAITRLAVSAQGASKLKVGSQLLIYKRTTS